jgi:hypothetical protein
LAGGVNATKNNLLQLTMEGGATVSEWLWFVYESGADLTVNVVEK